MKGLRQLEEGPDITPNRDRPMRRVHLFQSTPIPPEARLSRLDIVWIIALGIAWLPGVLVLAEVWSEVEYASHGFLVPLVALWTATAHRERLAQLGSRPLRWGPAGVAVTLVAYLIALSLAEPTLIGLSLIAGIVAALLALRGMEWVRTLTFPLGYLIFMVPLPTDWVTPLIVRLQILVSGVAVSILHAAGTPIYRLGNVLELPGGESLFVAEACSGITSLITLLPIGVFIAYFTETQLLRRLILVAAVLPIALLGNLLRVLLTVELAIRGNVGVATDGPLHQWAGVATYVFGCLVLLGIGAGMRRLWPDAGETTAA